MADVPVSISLTTKGVETASSSLNKIVNQINHLEKAQAANIAIGNLLSNVISRVANSAIAFGQNAISTADAIAKNSKTIGVSVENYQKLQYAARLSGIEFGALQMALQQMQRSIYANDDAFKKIGLNIEQLRKLSPTQQFQAIGDALKNIQDPAARTALSMEIFGRSGARVGAMAGDFANLSSEAEKLGIIMDASALQVVEKFNDMLTTLKLKFMAIFVNAIPQIKLFAETWLAEFRYILSNTVTIFEAVGKVVAAPFVNIAKLASGAGINDLITVQDIFSDAMSNMQDSLIRRQEDLAQATQNYTDALTAASSETSAIATLGKETERMKADRTRGLSAAIYGSQEAATAIAKYRMGQTSNIEKQQLDALNRIARGVESLAGTGEEEFAIL